MLYRALVLALATAHAWNDCAFPDVGYYAVDEALGLSFTYGLSAMVTDRHSNLGPTDLQIR